VEQMYREVRDKGALLVMNHGHYKVQRKSCRSCGVVGDRIRLMGDEE
jgi:hypothetical protein